MKPQERTAAIFGSRLEPSEKLLLMAVASFMSDDRLSTWCAPESLAELTGLSLSTVKALLVALVARGAITRTDEGHRAKVTRICWDALPHLAAKPAGRGGKQTPHGGSDNRTKPSDVRTVGSDDRTVGVRCSDGKGSDNRTRTDHGTDHQPTSVVGGGDPAREDRPPEEPHGHPPGPDRPPAEATPDRRRPDARPASVGGGHPGDGGRPRGTAPPGAQGGDAGGGDSAGGPPVDLPALLDGNHQLVAPLVAAGITTVEALTALTGREVQMRPGIGPKRLLAIAGALQRHGLAFAPDVAPEGRATTERPGLRRLTDRWCRAVLDVTGQPYRWTPSGPDSDQRAAAALYDAVGWGSDPDAAVQADVRGTVDRYLGHCRETGRVPTLPDLVRQLARWRQEPAPSQRRPARPTPDQARSMASGRVTRSLLDWADEEHLEVIPGGAHALA